MYDKKQKLISFMPKNNTVLIEGPVGVHVGSIVRKTMDSELNKTIEAKNSYIESSKHSQCGCLL